MTISNSKDTTWDYPRYSAYERTLRAKAANWFAEKGYAVDAKYPFILDKWGNWENNIIVPGVSDYITGEIRNRSIKSSGKEGFPLHKYVHHGLSSQAMLFNLITPLILENDLEPLKAALQGKGVNWPDVGSTMDYEYEDRNIFNENRAQPTSIDLVIKNAEGKPKLFIESKLVERGFGGCSLFGGGDCDGRNPALEHKLCYLHCIGRKYWQLLAHYGFLKSKLSTDSMCIMANHYQYFREVLFALEHDGIFVLLYDERNPTFFCKGKNDTRGLIPFLEQFIPTELKSRTANISIQEIVKEIEVPGKHHWITDFKKKYGV